MRALWLHYPADRHAVERDDEYLWGRNLLVAPVVEKGTTARRVYLPAGAWYDFWTEEKTGGGREISRPVDLSTLPLYIRAGSILPLGPAKQYTGEESHDEVTLVVYPGADGEFVLYEDDGVSFNYERGEFTRLRMAWDNRSRRLTLSLVEGSKLLAPSPRALRVRIAAGGAERSLMFGGTVQTVEF